MEPKTPAIGDMLVNSIEDIGELVLREINLISMAMHVLRETAKATSVEVLLIDGKFRTNPTLTAVEKIPV